MALVKLIKVHVKLQPTPCILLEQKNLKEYLMVEANSAVELSAFDGNSLKQNFSKICDAYGCLGAVHLNRGGESIGYFLSLVTGCKSVGRLLENDIYRITDVSFISIRTGAIESYSATSEMKRLLCSGSFYFLSSNVDGTKNSIFITNSLQSTATEERQEYLWNRNLIAYFAMRGIKCRTWLTYIMCGGVDIRTFYGSAQQGRVAVINRLSCERVGTRYNVRGVDYLGNVANFVESEQVICIGNSYSSFIMTRGSVPLYWEQPGLNVGSHKVKTPYSSEVSFQAFERHLEKLISVYSECVLVNLLGSKEGEAYLSRYYQDQQKLSGYSKRDPAAEGVVEMINFDYHAECRAGKSTNITKLMDQLNSKLEKFGVMYKISQNNDVQYGYQSGVLRVNCLDCLDRTNSVQTYVGLQMAGKQLASLGHSDKQQILGRVTEPLKAMWQYTGDLISRMYAGTGALEGKDAVGKLKDGAKSISRSIQNNFLDQGKQDTMDTLLRVPFHSNELYHLSRTMLTQEQFRGSPSLLLHSLFKEKQNFVEELSLRVCVGTWNVNGGKKFRSIAYKGKTIKDWLVHNDQLNQEHETTSLSYYQAIYEYSSAEDGDLCLVLNDFITVDYELEEGEWLHGSIGDRNGIFPASYVQRLANPYLVLHDFPAQQDGDLALWINEVVDVTEVNGEWLTGTLYRDGLPEEGTFPANFVEKIGSVSVSPAIDVYAIGFEEMVELNAGNIVNASLANQQAWALELQKAIAPNQEYVLVTSEQLVGVCLFLFVKAALAKEIGEVSVATLKTGMGGAAGNKGAVAISMSLYSTTFCFVCSHFAAGQTQVMERNSDFEEIYTKLTFAKGRPLSCHDYIFWCGDFNYRIDLPNDEVKELIKAKSWEKLKDNDQLLVQKKMRNVFKGFNEGNINFAPTYKYDLFSDDYDTSEKCRVPAWTDRVLWKRKNWLCENNEDESLPEIDSGTILLYDRTELKTSDHRPVVAVIDIRVTFILPEERDRLFDEFFDKIQPISCPLYVYVDGCSCDQKLCEDFIDYLNCGKVCLKKVFPNAYLVVYEESRMVKAALEYDGEIFQRKRMRLGVSNENTVDEAHEANQTLKIETGSTSAIQSDVKTFRGPSIPVSHSSGNLKSLHESTLKRQNSTPQLQASLPAASTDTPKPSKKPPPRPPAISNAPPRPPAFNNFSKSVAPTMSSPETGRSQNNFESSPEDGLNGFETSVESLQNASQNYGFPDLSKWRVPAEPPKIKPRKTVPKRRAPVPPNASQVQKGAPSLPPGLGSPLVPTKTTASLLPSTISGSHLDDAFGSVPTPLASLSSPLVPLRRSPVNNAQSMADSSLLSTFDPLATSSKPPMPARSAPVAPLLSKPTLPTAVSTDPFGDLSTFSVNSQDPWSSGGAVAKPTGNMNKSFTTDFGKLNFN